MRRKLVSLGVFNPSVWLGLRVEDGIQRRAYSKLKELGFVETRWQFIFDGQTGGLVFPFRDGLNEIHVRFYRDRIFAELELSRSSPLHFIFPLYNANTAVLEILEHHLDMNERVALNVLMNNNLRDQELKLDHWNTCVLLPIDNGVVKCKPNITRWVSWVQRALSWQFGPMVALTYFALQSNDILIQAIALAGLASVAFSTRFIPHSRRP